MKKQQKLIPLSPTLRSRDEYEWERFRQIKARFLQRFVKAKTKKQLMVYKGKFLEALVRLAFRRLNYTVKRYSRASGYRVLDLIVYNKKQNRVFCIEVTNWAKESYPHSEYKPSKRRAFKGLSKHVIRLWIVSHKESLDLFPKEEKRLAKSPYWIHFLELGRDYNYQDTGFDDYLKIKEKIKEFLRIASILDNWI